MCVGGEREREKRVICLEGVKLVGSFEGVTLPKKVCQQGAEESFQFIAEVSLT